MVLKVQCAECSRKYDVKDSLAGKEFQCRACGAVVAVPRRQRDEELDDLEEFEDVEELDVLEDADDEPPPRSARSRGPQRQSSKSGPPRRKSSEGQPAIILAGVGGGLAFLVIMGVLASAFIPRRPGNGAVNVPGNNALPNIAPNTGPATIPQPPLALTKPNSPGSQLGNVKLDSFEVDELRGSAAEFAAEGDYQKALLCQYAATEKTNDGQYNLACYYSRVGNAEAALYYIQLAAKEEGVDCEWVLEDADLINVRNDSRWPVMLQYLRQYNRYWQASGVSETSLIMPANASRDRPLPVLIGLHGMGSSAHDFVDAESYQQFADANQIAVLGVSGTHPKGKRSFVWSEIAGQDLARIDAALKEVSDRLTVQPGQAILFGFSQGGLMSAEIAARHPDRFAGAIVMSPGGNSGAQIAGLRAAGNQSRQGYIVVCGQGEHPGNVALTNDYASGLRSLHTRVFFKLYPGQNQHTFPEDYYTRLPAWCSFILNPQAPVPAS